MTQTKEPQLSTVGKAVVEALRDGWELRGRSCDGPYSLQRGHDHTSVPSPSVQALVRCGVLTVIPTWRTQFYVLREEHVEFVE